MPSGSQRVDGPPPPPALPFCDGWMVTTCPTSFDLRECRKFHDERGDVAFRLSGGLLLAPSGGTIALADPRGDEIGRVRRRRGSLCSFGGGGGLRESAWCFEYRDKDRAGFVRAKGTMFSPTKCTADIYLGDEWIGETEGCWFTKSFAIYIEGIEAASVLRTQEHAAGGGFNIAMAAGVDASLVLLIVLALGEMYEWADCCLGGVASSILSYGGASGATDPRRPGVWRGMLG